MSHVFISYSTQNSDYAYQLADKLREEGFDVWIDNRQLRSSDNWWESIVRALRGCGAFIVIMTPEARESRWVQREVTLADKWKKPAFPVLLEGDYDQWEIYILTQYEDVRLPDSGGRPQYKGKLPPDIFYSTLAKYATREQRMGNNLINQLAMVADDAEIRREIVNPPASDTGALPAAPVKPANALRLNTRAMVMVAIGAAIVVMLLIVGLVLLNRPPSSETILQAQVDETATLSQQFNEYASTMTTEATQQVASLASPTLTSTATQLPSETPTLTQTISPSPTRTATATSMLTPTNNLILIPTSIAEISNTGQIAFTSDRDGNDEIYVMNTDGSNLRRLTNNTADDENPVWSPNGSHIAFTSNGDGNAEIYVMNADGSNPHNLTHNSAVDLAPSWSPNGNQITFSTGRDGNAEIYVMNADGSNPHNLTHNSTIDYEFAWSPDGSQIAFTSNRDGNYEIYVMNIDGNNVRQLTNMPAGNYYDKAWSPDGNQIAFSSVRAALGQIYVMNADGSNPHNLNNSKTEDAFPSWSPDGQQITFTSNRDGNYEIYVMNADGSNPRNISNNLATDAAPSWRPSAPKPDPLLNLPVIVNMQPTLTATTTPTLSG